jgi:glucokinase
MLTMDTPANTEPGKANDPITIGVVVSERLYAGLLRDGKLAGSLLQFPEGSLPRDPEDDDSLIEYHTEALVEAICDITLRTANGQKDNITGVGVAIPGLIRNGVVEEAPNLPQLKGARMSEMIAQALTSRGLHAPVVVSNDADAIAAGLAARHGKLDTMMRVFTLGTGIGYGCYPFTDGVWEGGHITVTLDERENYCGCGGRGHLEGIMGHRAMRLRFLDMEPEEVFEAATRRKDPIHRCVEFRDLWHRALAAAVASSIHVMGAGKFFFTGYNVRFLDLNLQRNHLHEMVKMSPLQGYQLDIVPEDQSTRVLGAAIAAEQAATRC